MKFILGFCFYFTAIVMAFSASEPAKVKGEQVFMLIASAFVFTTATAMITRKSK